MSAAYLYHYHAFREQAPGGRVDIDGIAATHAPIATMADYDALKERIALDNDVLARGLVLASLTPLGQVEMEQWRPVPRVKEIVVNGRRIATEQGVLGYADVVGFAGRDGTVLHTITWSTAEKSGTLEPGRHVVVEPGMVFTAVITGDA